MVLNWYALFSYYVSNNWLVRNGFESSLRNQSALPFNNRQIQLLLVLNSLKIIKSSLHCARNEHTKPWLTAAWAQRLQTIKNTPGKPEIPSAKRKVAFFCLLQRQRIHILLLHGIYNGNMLVILNKW